MDFAERVNQFVLAFFTVIKYLSLLFYFVWTVCSLNFKPIQYVMTQKVSRPCLYTCVSTCCFSRFLFLSS